MTPAEIAARFQTVWAGGPLLPDYPSGSSLLQQGVGNPPDQRELRRRLTRRTYHAATLARVRQLASFGYCPYAIAKQLGLPRTSVVRIVRGHR